MKFEWNNNKNLSNIKKHGISFEEAQTVFYNENAIIFDDIEHSHSEDRFIIVGFSSYGTLLLSCFCEKRNDLIRIISARRLTKKEARDFNKRWGK